MKRSRSTLVRTITLFASLTTAQQCYYPNGAPSNDVPCENSAASPCCGQDAFCLRNGLCFEAGSMSRGSCTDKSWASDACPSICTSTSPSSSAIVVPCSATANGNISFGCGFGAAACQSSSSVFLLSGSDSIVLRPAQVADLVGPVLSSFAATENSTCSDSASSANGYSAGALVGVAMGLAIPLLIALGTALFFLQRERRRKPKLLYQLSSPSKEEFTFRPPDAAAPADRHTSFSQPLDATRLGPITPRSEYSDRPKSSSERNPSSALVSPVSDRFPTSTSPRPPLEARPAGSAGSSSASSSPQLRFQQQFPPGPQPQLSHPQPLRQFNTYAPAPLRPRQFPSSNQQPQHQQSHPQSHFTTNPFLDPTTGPSPAPSPSPRQAQFHLMPQIYQTPQPQVHARPQSQSQGQAQNPFAQDTSLIQLDLPPPSRYELGPRMSEDGRP